MCQKYNFSIIKFLFYSVCFSFALSTLSFGQIRLPDRVQKEITYQEGSELIEVDFFCNPLSTMEMTYNFLLSARFFGEVLFNCSEMEHNISTERMDHLKVNTLADKSAGISLPPQGFFKITLFSNHSSVVCLRSVSSGYVGGGVYHSEGYTIIDLMDKEILEFNDLFDSLTVNNEFTFLLRKKIIEISSSLYLGLPCFCIND